MFNRKGRSILKKGRDGRNSCTSCHSVTEICSGLSIPHPIPHPIPPSKKILFGSVSVRPMSHTVVCLLPCRNVRSPSLGLKSECIAFIHCLQSHSQAQYQVTVVRIFTPSTFTYLCNFITVFGW